MTTLDITQEEIDRYVRDFHRAIKRNKSKQTKSILHPEVAVMLQKNGFIIDMDKPAVEYKGIMYHLYTIREKRL